MVYNGPMFEDLALLSALPDSTLPQRVFVALMILCATSAVHALLYPLYIRLFGLRPAFETMCDTLFTAVITRLNRPYRSRGERAVRGAIVFVLCLMVCFLVMAGLRLAAAYIPGGDAGAFALFLCLSPVVPVIHALSFARRTKKQKDRDSAFRRFARAGYVNLIHLDDPGLARMAIKLTLTGFIGWAVLPVLIYIAFGGFAVLIYGALSAALSAAGRGGIRQSFSRLFMIPLAICHGLAQFPAALLMVVAAFFTGSASFLKAFGGLFPKKGVPSVLEGGRVLSVMAYSLNLTLGGPYQDRFGTPVAGGWVGPEGSSAQVKTRDIVRTAYIVAVALFLFIVLLYAATYFSAGHPAAMAQTRCETGGADIAQTRCAPTLQTSGH